MGIVGNYLWRLGSKIQLSPSKDVNKKQGAKKRAKGKKKRTAGAGSNTIDLSAIEMGEPSPLIQIEREIMKPYEETIRRQLEAKIQEAIQDVENKGVCFCACGGRGEYKGLLHGHLIGMHGKVLIHYRRYRCPVCGRAMYPALEQLGLSPRSWTPYVSALLLMLCVLVPFKQAEKLAKYFWNLDVSASGIWNLSKRTGERLLAWQEKTCEVYNNPHYDFQRRDDQAPDVIEMGIDGAMALCRRKKGEAPAPTDCDEQDPIDPKAPPCGKEIKSAVIFKPQDRVQVSKNRRELLERTVVALRGGADAFFALLWASLAHYGLIGPETSVVIVADGAKWIWNRAGMFDNRVEILDFWHAAQHAWDCAKLLWPTCPVSIASWAKAMRRTIKDGKVAEVIEHLQELLEHAKEHTFGQKAAEALRKLIAYYTEHASRMDYPSYLARGYSIGSGSVESVHKQLLHARMRLSGMRWSERGASRMVALRTRYLNDRWNEAEAFLRAA